VYGGQVPRLKGRKITQFPSREWLFAPCAWLPSSGTFRWFRIPATSDFSVFHCLLAKTFDRRFLPQQVMLQLPFVIRIFFFVGSLPVSFRLERYFFSLGLECFLLTLDEERFLFSVDPEQLSFSAFSFQLERMGLDRLCDFVW
jgi:hypothetical protein